MVEALLYGKLSREQENMEDLLTSMVFGILKYLGPEILGVFLSFARTPEDARPLHHLTGAQSAAFEFWPTLSEAGCMSCEPDVLLTVKDASGRETWVLVEAKFRSGKSSFADSDENHEQLRLLEPRPAKDQLAKEWENLAARGANDAVVLYLTADMAMPRKDIAEAQFELAANGKPPGQFCWLSWSSLHGLREQPNQSAMLLDLLSVLERLSLVPLRPFQGGMLPQLRWSFAASPRLWCDVSQIPLPSWSFEASPVLCWDWPVFSPPLLSWRFKS